MFDLSHVGELALASRIKSLSELMYGSVDKAYQQLGSDFQSRWFPVVVHLYSERRPMGISELALKIGQTHASVSQIAKSLLKAGLVGLPLILMMNVESSLS